MAEPGDPQTPDDHDDLIGFASPASLQGHVRTPAEPGPGPEPQPQPEQPALEPQPGSGPGPTSPVEPEARSEPELFTASMAASIPVEPEPAAPAAAPVRAEPAPVPEPAAPPPGRPVRAASIFERSPEFSARPGRREPATIPGGGMGLYAVYALILFAVPTMGVSAIVGLFAVTGRAGPEDPVSLSHFLYQQRTLWVAAVAVAVGLIFFLVPFGLGPAIMFVAALWLVVRGAAGVWALTAGRPIADPRGWWI